MVLSNVPACWHIILHAKGGVIAIHLYEGDELAWVNVTDGNEELLVATKKRYLFALKKTDCMRNGAGTACGAKAFLRLKEDDCKLCRYVLHQA